MAALSNRELELMLANVAAKQKRAPSSPRLSGHATIADQTKRAIRWLLDQFSPVRVAQEMHDRGITLGWMIGILADIANDAEVPPRCRMQAVDKLRQWYSIAAAAHPDAQKALGTNRWDRLDWRPPNYDPATDDPALRIARRAKAPA